MDGRGVEVGVDLKMSIEENHANVNSYLYMNVMIYA